MRSLTEPDTKVTTIPKVTRIFFSNDEFVSFAVVAFFMVTFAAQAAAAVVDPELRVVIRTYDASATPADLAPALVVATAILEDAGVAVRWVSCDAVFVRREDDPCLAPLAANELAIRFVRLLPHIAAQDVVTLGDSLVDTRLRGGALATIYVNRVAALAGRCRVEVPALLGRAAAHEIGHLLLGTSAHASSGLMRAAWTQQALRRARSEEWVFTPRDAQAMRDAVRGRTARRLAAARIGE